MSNVLSHISVEALVPIRVDIKQSLSLCLSVLAVFLAFFLVLSQFWTGSAGQLSLSFNRQRWASILRLFRRLNFNLHVLPDWGLSIGHVPYSRFFCFSTSGNNTASLKARKLHNSYNHCPCHALQGTPYESTYCVGHVVLAPGVTPSALIQLKLDVCVKILNSVSTWLLMVNFEKYNTTESATILNHREQSMSVPSDPTDKNYRKRRMSLHWQG